MFHTNNLHIYCLYAEKKKTAEHYVTTGEMSLNPFPVKKITNSPIF